jgi:acetyltransferase EpsM
MKTYIVGAGAHGRVTVDILRAAGSTNLAFIDDSLNLRGKSVAGVAVEGGIDHLFAHLDNAGVVVAIGKPPARAAIVSRLTERGADFINAIHPSALVMPSATLGTGNILGPLAIVETNARLGNHCLVNANVLVAHDGKVGNCVNLAPGVLLGGRVTVHDQAFIAIGARVLPRLTVGFGAIVGATALVTNDVPERVMVVGSPAKLAWAVNDEFDWSKLL